MSLTVACGTSTLSPLLSMRITLPESFPVDPATCCDMQQLAVSAAEIIRIAIVRMAVSVNSEYCIGNAKLTRRRTRRQNLLIRWSFAESDGETRYKKICRHLVRSADTC